MNDSSSPPRVVNVHVFRRVVPAAAAKIWATHAWSEMQHRPPAGEWVVAATKLLIEASEAGDSTCRILGSLGVMNDLLTWCEAVPGWYYGDVPVWMYWDVEEKADHDIPTQTDG